MDTEAKIQVKELQLTHALEHFKSVITMAELALKNAILVNGGAAIALLTFIGNTKPADHKLIVVSLFLFAFGVLLGALAIFFAYLAQNYFMSQINARKEFVENPWQKITAIAICGSSYAAFAGGVVSAGFGFIYGNI